MGKETGLIARTATERIHVGYLTNFNFPCIDKREFIFIHQFHTKIYETQEQKHESPVSIFKGGITVYVDFLSVILF